MTDDSYDKALEYAASRGWKINRRALAQATIPLLFLGGWRPCLFLAGKMTLAWDGPWLKGNKCDSKWMEVLQQQEGKP